MYYPVKVCTQASWYFFIEYRDNLLIQSGAGVHTGLCGRKIATQSHPLPLDEDTNKPLKFIFPLTLG